MNWPEGTQPDRCRSCHAEIVWCATTRGKAMPVDREATRGNVHVTNSVAVDTRYGLVPVVRVDHTASDGAYTAHHATCPQGDQWRRRNNKPAGTWQEVPLPL